MFSFLFMHIFDRKCIHVRCICIEILLSILENMNEIFHFKNIPSKLFPVLALHPIVQRLGSDFLLVIHFLSFYFFWGQKSDLEFYFNIIITQISLTKYHHIQSN